MAKSIWEGHLRLSLVTCPVALFKAIDSRGGVSFHLINPKTKSRIVTVAKDPTTGRELDRKTLVKGFEIKKDNFVLINHFLLTTLRTHEDIVDARQAGVEAKLPKPDKNMLEIAEKIIEQQEGEFDPKTFTDRYEDAVRDLIKRKQKGQKPTEAPEPEPDDGKVVNLMDALRRSLAGGKARKPKAKRRAA